jgi:opacity protein-like surface antigen
MKNLKNITTAIVAVILLATSAAAQTVKPAAANETFTVKYIGNQDDYLYFQVEINTGTGNYALLKINDKEEGELYSQSLRKDLKLQTFKIEKKDGQELNFKLLSGNKTYSKTFSASTILIEKTTVNENDVVIL